MMETFFRKTGNNQLRFKPAYNPYTEPSMEIFSYHEGLKRWIEVGNVSVLKCLLVLPLRRCAHCKHACLVRNLPTRDAGTYGSSQGCPSARLGNVSRATHHDQVSLSVRD